MPGRGRRSHLERGDDPDGPARRAPDSRDRGGGGLLGLSGRETQPSLTRELPELGTFFFGPEDDGPGGSLASPRTRVPPPPKGVNPPARGVTRQSLAVRIRGLSRPPPTPRGSWPKSAFP